MNRFAVVVQLRRKRQSESHCWVARCLRGLKVDAAVARGFFGVASGLLAQAASERWAAPRPGSMVSEVSKARAENRQSSRVADVFGGCRWMSVIRILQQFSRGAIFFRAPTRLTCRTAA
jgi:hypothetical protein